MAVVINGSTGIATPDGTAGVPSHTGTSGSTNGLYFPTATSAAISTNGLQAIAIDSSQNVTHTAATTFVGNLTFSGASARFLGDFSNATVTSRTSFQTSTTNGSTGIYALPNGTSTAASWQATNAADPTNASKVLIATNGSTDVQLVSGRNGTGTYLPLSFYTNGTQNAQLDTSGNLTTVGTVNMGHSFKRNRIINGDMRIDQRNAGASATIPNALTYTLDRWQAYGSQSSKFTVQQNAGSVTPPAGFVNYLGVTSSSSYSVLAADEFFIQQKIEGLNVSDFGFGTANAKTITISFWVRSSLTGTFGASIFNSGQTRCYPFLYTISAANTWTQISITIAGDTTGTWLTSNSLGLGILFGLGVGSTYGSGTAGAWVGSTVDVPASSVSVVGTNGATFYITGVQLEVGSIATPYERQIYSEQLAQCQRYLPAFSGTGQLGAGGNASSTTQAYTTIIFPVPARVAATGMTINAASNFVIGCAGVTADFTCTAVSASNHSTSGSLILSTVSSGLTAGQVITMRGNGSALMYFTGCEL